MEMKVISTRAAAKRLGVHFATLAQKIAAGKLPAPPMIKVGRLTVHMWTEEQIETVRKLLPKIANGRKTRYQKLREKQGTQAHALRKRGKQTKKPKKKK